MKKTKWKANPPAEFAGILTTAQAAALMGISTRTFYKIVNDGEIDCYAEYGTAHLFRVDEVLKVRKRLYGY